MLACADSAAAAASGVRSPRQRLREALAISPAIPFGFWLTPLARPAGPTWVMAVKMPPVHAAPNHAKAKFAHPANSAPAEQRDAAHHEEQHHARCRGTCRSRRRQACPRCIASRHPVTAPSAARRRPRASAFVRRGRSSCTPPCCRGSRRAARRALNVGSATSPTTIIADEGRVQHEEGERRLEGDAEDRRAAARPRTGYPARRAARRR